MRLFIDPVERLSLALGASAVAVSFAVATPRFALSLAFGAALEAVNLRGLLRSAQLMFGGEMAGARPWVGGFGARFGLLVLGIWAALSLEADAAGLLIGLSLAVPAAIATAWINRPPVLEHDALPPVDPDDESWDDWNIWRAGEVSLRPEALDTALSPGLDDDDTRADDAANEERR